MVVSVLGSGMQLLVTVGCPSTQTCCALTHSCCTQPHTQGKGEYSMAYSHHAPVSRDLQEELMTGYARTAGGKAAATAA